MPWSASKAGISLSKRVSPFQRAFRGRSSWSRRSPPWSFASSPAGWRMGASPGAWLKKGLSLDLPLPALSERWGGLAGLAGEALPPAARESWKGLQDLLRGIGGTEPDSLREGLERSGLFLEAALRRLVEAGPAGRDPSGVGPDVKGLLLKLLGELPAPPEGDDDPGRRLLLKEVGEAAGDLLHKIELFQGLAMSQSDPGTKALLLLPLFFQERLRFGELCLQLPPRREGRGDGGEASLLFLLDLPSLGRVKIDVRMREKELYCVFTLAGGERADGLARALPELAGRLERLGFRSRVSVAQCREEALPSSLVGEMVGESEGMVNIRI